MRCQRSMKCPRHATKNEVSKGYNQAWGVQCMQLSMRCLRQEATKYEMSKASNQAWGAEMTCQNTTNKGTLSRREQLVPNYVNSGIYFTSQVATRIKEVITCHRHRIRKTLIYFLWMTPSYNHASSHLWALAWFRFL